MEILGIVWAASILAPSSLIASSEPTAAEEVPHYQQATPQLEESASWFSSLSKAYGWASYVLPEAIAHTANTSHASWLLSELSEINFSQDDMASEESFSSLSPAIGIGLTSLEVPLEDGTVAPDSGAEASFDQWHSWNAVAAVRLQEVSEVSSNADASSNLDRQCMPDMSAPYQASPIAVTASPKIQIWVHNRFIGEVSGQTAARKIADKLRALIKEGLLNPSQLRLLKGSSFIGAAHNNDILFVVDEAMRSHPEIPAAAVAVQWVNNLRLAFEEKPLSLAQIQMATEGLAETSETLYGTASWYGPGFHGRKTANGERFNQNTLTAAHKTLPFNTYLKVTNRLNGQSVVVRINDRGPYIGNRSLDLSKAAAQCLGSTGVGVVPYEAVILESVPEPSLDELTTAQLPAEE